VRLGHRLRLRRQPPDVDLPVPLVHLAGRLDVELSRPGGVQLVPGHPLEELSLARQDIALDRRAGEDHVLCSDQCTKHREQEQGRYDWFDSVHGTAPEGKSRACPSGTDRQTFSDQKGSPES